jgi:hypothetical protein
MYVSPTELRMHLTSHPIPATYPAHFVRLDLLTRVIFGAMSSVPTLYCIFDVIVT